MGDLKKWWLAKKLRKKEKKQKEPSSTQSEDKKELQRKSKKRGRSGDDDASKSSKLRCTGKAKEYFDVSNGADESVLEEDEQELETEVEGVFHNGVMLLINREEGLVYSSERNEEGDLIEIGHVDADGEINITATEEGEASADIIDYPFQVDEDDHCETPERAYAHIAPFLEGLAIARGKSKSKAKLKIYDPYFCQGSVVKRLADLGFPRVHNVNEDCYKVQAEGRVPRYHALVTNPPYSLDHVERLMEYCASSGRAWLLLLPNYVYLKDFCKRIMAASPTGFFLTPPSRYYYYSPKGSRANVRSSERKTSPFITFWYIDLGPKYSQAALEHFHAAQELLPESERCIVAKSAHDLPFKMMDSSDPLRKKERDRRRSTTRLSKKSIIGITG